MTGWKPRTDPTGLSTTARRHAPPRRRKTPATVAAGERAWLVNKSRAPGHLRVLLSDAAGEVELQTLFEVDVTGGIDGVEGLTIREWTADVTPGEYRIRWVFTTGEHNEHRDYPIVVE